MNEIVSDAAIPENGKGNDMQIIEGRPIHVAGRWLKIARIKAEEYAEVQPIENPNSFIEGINAAQLSADLFCFAQPIDELEPKFPNYYMEWDNFAAIRLGNYEDWWTNLSQDSRRNVRTAEKRGVKVRVANFDDNLIRAIKAIYDETPIRQGYRNRHYKEDLNTVREKNSTYLGRNDFLVAEVDDEVIGFLQIIYVGGTARIMQLLGKVAHVEKRPTNALVAKAVELSCQKRLKYLTYCKYTYGKKESSSLTEFKRRMGFKKVNYPRYYVPLTLVGRIALGLRLHHGAKNLVPRSGITFFLNARAKYYDVIFRKHLSVPSRGATKECQQRE